MRHGMRRFLGECYPRDFTIRSCMCSASSQVPEHCKHPHDFVFPFVRLVPATTAVFPQSHWHFQNHAYPVCENPRTTSFPNLCPGERLILPTADLHASLMLFCCPRGFYEKPFRYGNAACGQSALETTRKGHGNLPDPHVLKCRSCCHAADSTPSTLSRQEVFQNKVFAPRRVLARHFPAFSVDKRSVQR